MGILGVQALHNCIGPARDLDPGLGGPEPVFKLPLPSRPLSCPEPSAPPPRPPPPPAYPSVLLLQHGGQTTPLQEQRWTTKGSRAAAGQRRADVRGAVESVLGEVGDKAEAWGGGLGGGGGPQTPQKGDLDKKCLCLQDCCSVVSNSLRPHGLQQARPPCPSPASQDCCGEKKKIKLGASFRLSVRFGHPAAHLGLEG